MADLPTDDFGAFYERHVTVVTAYVARRAARPDLTFDLVAETFARALEHRGRFDPRRGPAVAWLLGIAHNLMVDAVRRGRVADAARERLGMTPIALDDAALERVLDRGDLEDALERLPVDQRDAVRRRVLEEQAYPEIAASVGCSEQVVRQRVSRGLATLRRGMEDR